jgi:hypothetical protein
MTVTVNVYVCVNEGLNISIHKSPTALVHFTLYISYIRVAKYTLYDVIGDTDLASCYGRSGF